MEMGQLRVLNNLENLGSELTREIARTVVIYLDNSQHSDHRQYTNGRFVQDLRGFGGTTYAQITQALAFAIEILSVQDNILRFPDGRTFLLRIHLHHALLIFEVWHDGLLIS
jgi:hypothetical protein